MKVNEVIWSLLSFKTHVQEYPYLLKSSKQCYQIRWVTIDVTHWPSLSFEEFVLFSPLVFILKQILVHM